MAICTIRLEGPCCFRTVSPAESPGEQLGSRENSCQGFDLFLNQRGLSIRIFYINESPVELHVFSQQRA